MLKNKVQYFIICFLLIVCFTVNAATYYIDPNGSNKGGIGSKNNPWQSLSYACSQVQNAGDIIWINAGNYTDNSTCNLALGVSIKGP